jgi:hypothetical protein
MATKKVMPDFLTDEEMKRLEAEQQSPDFLTDDEMAELERKETAMPQNPSAMQSLLPRTTQTLEDVKQGEGSFIGNVGRVTRDLTLDQLSGLGRALSSVPALMPGGEGFGEAMARKEAPKDAGGVRKFAENTLRDPALIPGIAATGGASSLVKAPAAAPLRMGIREIGKRVGVAAGRGALESIPSAIIHQTENAAETGDVDVLAGLGEVATGAALGLGTKLTRAAFNKVLNGPKEAANKIMASYLKPPLKIYDDGFKPENIGKHNLFGTTSEIVAQANQKLKSASNEMDRMLKAASEEGATVNAGRFVFEVADEIASKKLDVKNPNLFMKTGDEAMPIEKASTQINELIAYLTDGNDVVDLATAQRLKQTIGNLGDWSHGSGDADKDAIEALANGVYMKFKDEIERQLPEKAKALNKAMSEIIPIKRAALRRLPIDQRNDAIGLADVTAFTNAFSSESMEGNAAGTAIGLLRRAARSPLVAEGLDMLGGPGKSVAPGVLKTGDIVAPPIRQSVRSSAFRVTNPKEEENEAAFRRRMAESMGKSFGGR